MMRSLRAVLTAKPVRLAVTGAVVVAAVVIGVEVTKGTPTYPINVVYASAPGLFTGAAVDVLGVKVGTVTDVQNVGDKVDVTLAVDQGTRIPSSAFASLVAPQLLGSPDVDLNPGYTGGPSLPAGATIPQDHTAVPVSTDEVLKELQHTLDAINPQAVGNLVTNLATDLDGQGTNLNKLIASAAGTVQLLATKGDDLGQLNGTLAQLTGTLDSDTAQIEQLVEQYDTVSTTVAQHSGQLNDAITQLAGASSGLVSLLTPNLQPLEADVGTVTTVGRTLDRNLASVDEILQDGNSLFQGAKRAYDPTYDWLDLNLATAPGVTGAYIAGLLRDRLAGICRRIVANHSSGLSAPVLAGLNQCGNPVVGLLRPVAQRHPDDPRHPEWWKRSRNRPVAPPAGADTDLPDRAGQRDADANAGTGLVPVTEEHRRHPDDHHHDDDRAADHDHHDLRPPRGDRGVPGELGLVRLVGRLGRLGRLGSRASGLGGLLSNRVARTPEGGRRDPCHGDAVGVHAQRGADAHRARRGPAATAPAGPGVPAPCARTVGSWRGGSTTWRDGSDGRCRRSAAGTSPASGHCARPRRRGRRAGRLLPVRRRGAAHRDGRLHRRGRPRQRRAGADGGRARRLGPVDRARRRPGQGHARLRQRGAHSRRRQRGHRPHHDPR